MYEIKRLEQRSLPAALAKAAQYRALNEPEDAESICRDVLDVAPDDQEALRTLGLAMTDRFGTTPLLEEALSVFARLRSEYDRVYYAGVAWERCGKAHLEKGEAHNSLHCFENALESFAEAEKLAAPGTPDPILRWNRCVRAILAHPELVHARREPRSAEIQFGD